jgi:DNA-binding transcriptional MerR regulator
MALAAVSTKKATAPKTANKVASPTEIPDKLMFRIGEVSRIVGVEAYVLRYWETEFPQLAPKKSGSGHRMYRRKEVEQLLLIRQLLYERQYTIKGARNYLKELARRKTPHLMTTSSSEAASYAAGEPDQGTASGNALDLPQMPPLSRSGQQEPPAISTNLGSLRQELRDILALLS